MPLGELINLLQKASVQHDVTRDVPVIMRINDKGAIGQHFIDNVVIRHDVETDSVIVILEREIAK